MENKYDDFDLELSTDMLDDIEENKVENIEDEKPPINDELKVKKQVPRKIKILVFIGVILLLVAIVFVRLLGYYTTSRNKPIVDVKPTTESTITSGDVVDKNNETFKIEGLEDNSTNKDNIGVIPSYEDINNSGGITNDTFKLSDKDLQNQNNNGVIGLDGGNVAPVEPQVSKPQVQYPSKRGLTVLQGMVGGTSNNGTSTGDVKKNSNPKDVIKNAPKGEDEKTSYYSRYLETSDLINAYNMGISNEEYYKRYIAKDGFVLTSNNTSTSKGSSVDSDLSWKSRQSGIKAVESFDEYDLKEGSYIPVTIASDIRSDRPGVFQAIVREDVYDSLNHKYTLIPKGSKILGTYSALSNKDAKHLDMIVRKIILPNGKSINLGSMNITDLQGVRGGVGYKDEKYGERILKSALTLAVGLTSDFIGNTSIGTNGFSIGKKHFDYNLNKLTPPKDDDKAIDTGSNPNVDRTRVTSGYGISLKEANDIILALNKAPLSNEFKKDLNNGYRRVINESRDVNENILGYIIAKLISDKIGNAIYGEQPINPGGAGSNGGTSGTTSTSSGTYGTSPNVASGNDGNILSSLLGIPGVGGGSNGILGGQGGGILSGLNGIQDIKNLIKESQLEKEREQLGTNNIVKDVKTTLGEVKQTWNSVTPVIHIKGGARLNLYVSSDISLEPYIARVNKK